MSTIVAISTPPGEGGLAVVRLSGPESRCIGERVLQTSSGGALPWIPRQARLARATDPASGRALDQVLALWMPGPHSYTREDVLEIQCHGGGFAARSIVDACLSAGARLAEPGEFTLRAFLGGRIDLVQAEAVLDLIRARGEAAQTASHGLLGGELSAEIKGWQEELARLLMPLEASLDFSDEDDVGAPDGEFLISSLKRLAEAMGAKLATYAWGRAVRDGFSVALVGTPNVGKSTLLNRLAGEERAIVTDVPGTTRDLVETWITLEGVPTRIVDTAGLRQVPSDVVEEEGIRRTRQAAEAADVVVVVIDGSRALRSEEVETVGGYGRRALVVVNKIDLGAAVPAPVLEEEGFEMIAISALSGEGMGRLTAEIARRLGLGANGLHPETPLTRARHREAVEAARAGVVRARDLLIEQGFPEVVADELHGARACLASLLGEGTPEDVLDRIFSEFCVGK